MQAGIGHWPQFDVSKWPPVARWRYREGPSGAVQWPSPRLPGTVSACFSIDLMIIGSLVLIIGFDHLMTFWKPGLQRREIVAKGDHGTLRTDHRSCSDLSFLSSRRAHMEPENFRLPRIFRLYTVLSDPTFSALTCSEFDMFPLVGQAPACTEAGLPRGDATISSCWASNRNMKQLAWGPGHQSSIVT